jgi:hypothetical protein
MNLVKSRAIALALVAAAVLAGRLRQEARHAHRALAGSVGAGDLARNPAPPTGDPPGTTPVSSNSSEMSKAVESNSMPLPGQPNDHSNVAPLPSQNSDTQHVLKSTAAAEQANNGAERKTQ